MNKLLLRNEETVEVLDFRDQELVNLFKVNPVDHALLKLKNNKSEDNFLGVSKPFKFWVLNRHFGYCCGSNRKKLRAATTT